VAHLGLSLALESLAQSVSRLHRVNCTFRRYGQVAASDDQVAMHLYRIAQEAVQNALRHGRAKNIAISLQSAGELLTLCVSDDGTGIASPAADGIGLAIMRYRARISGGELSIEQSEAGGTIIVCTAKLTPLEFETAAA
jgi:two-component system, LuxR family, sensor kinase FixL